jgi:protein TonB
LEVGPLQESPRALPGGSLASSALLHLGALLLALLVSLPPRPGRVPPDSITLDLSRLEMVTELPGGGSQGQPTAPVEAAVLPAPDSAPAPQAVPAPQPSAKPAPLPPPQPRSDARLLERVPEPAATPPPAAPLPGEGGTGDVSHCPYLSAYYAGGGQGVGTGTGQGIGHGVGHGVGEGVGDGAGDGTGDGILGIPRSYLLALRSEIERRKTYPVQARREGVEGEVRMSFVVQSDGTISDVEVVGSSGHPELDRAASGTLQKLGRVAPLPSSSRLSRLRLELPMLYRLTR